MLVESIYIFKLTSASALATVPGPGFAAVGVASRLFDTLPRRSPVLADVAGFGDVIEGAMMTSRYSEVQLGWVRRGMTGSSVKRASLGNGECVDSEGC